MAKKQSKQYDKIIKENIQDVVWQLVRKTIQDDLVSFEVLYPELQYTIEREADFIMKVKDKNGQLSILHIEFQTQNDAKMPERMLCYVGLIYKAYQLPIKQVVFYFGNQVLSMPSHLSMIDFEYAYEIVDLKKIPYQRFLQSDNPEEVLIALLGDFGNNKSDLVVEQILLKLVELTNGLHLQKLMRQLDLLAVLRDLQVLVIQKEKDMAITFDIRKDYYYQEGLQQGMQQGMQQVALEMLKEGIKPEKVSKITKIPLDTIKEMLRELQKK
jgi:hypothetical protein